MSVRGFFKCDSSKLSLLITLLLSAQNTLAEEIRAQDDFNLHMNRAWQEQVVIPPSEVYVGAISDADKAVKAKVEQLFERLLAKSDWPEGSNEAAVVALYHSWMNWDQRNQLGLLPLAPAFQKIDAIKTAADLFDPTQPYETLLLFGSVLELEDNGAIYEDGTVAPSISAKLPLLGQRDFEGEGSEQIKLLEAVALHAYKRLGDPDPEQATADFIRLTRERAKYLLTDAEAREADTSPEKMSLDELAKRLPTLPLAELIKNLASDEYKGSVYYGKDKILKSIEVLLVDTPVDQLKRYLKAVHYIHNMRTLAREDYEAYFNLYLMPARGMQEIPDDSQEAKEYVGNYLPTIMGRLYAKANFSPESHDLFEEMVNGLKKTMADRINAVPWMSQVTRAKALNKLDKMGVMVGQAKDARQIDPSIVIEDDFHLTSRQIKISHAKIKFDLLGRHVDVDTYFFPVLTPNAYNDFYNNNVIFPYGILNKPFYDEKLALKDKASAYGAIGMVIGHEITHGFDDQGSQFDADGIKRNWWTEEDKNNFNVLAKKMVAFYNNETYEVEGKKYSVNGELTLGENIADFGGLAIAYDAYRKTDEFKQGALIDGKSPTQRFFETYGKLWRAKVRPQVMMNIVKYDVHAPNSARVNAPLKNMDHFQGTYGVKSGDGMYIAPEQRIKIW